MPTTVARKKGTPRRTKKLARGIVQVFNATAGALLHWHPIPVSDQQVYRICRTFRLPGTASYTFATSTTLESKYATSFALDDVNDYADIIKVFDEFRLAQVEVWVTPQTIAAGTGGQIVSVVDYNDASTISTVAIAMNHNNAVVSNVTMGHYRKFTPAAALAAYDGTIFGGYAVQSAPWLEVASADTEHYGLKVNVDVTTGSYGIWIDCRMVIELRRSN